MVLVEKFSKSSRSKTGLQTYCKSCQYEKNREFRIKNLDKRREQERKSRDKNVDYNTWNWVRKRAALKSIPMCSLDEFKEWFSCVERSCIYCGMSNDEAVKEYGHRLHIDRMECLKGYIVGNMVMACQRCNFVKSAYLTHEQMKEVAERYFKK